jgi:hypothetical protein
MFSDEMMICGYGTLSIYLVEKVVEGIHEEPNDRESKSNAQDLSG